MADSSEPILAGLVSLVAATLFLPAVVRGLRARSVLDFASERSSHSGAVVRGAGIALGGAVLLSLLVTRSTNPSILITVVGFTALGAWDDVISLRAGRRLGLQLVLAASASWALVSGSGYWLGYLMLGLLLLSATTNAVNFMDGINGITALHALVWGVLFSVVLRSGSSIELVALALALAGAATAFLPWNLVAARAFLGDSGSYLVGGVVGLLSLNALIVAGPVVALCPLAIYAADTGSTLLRRLMRRAPLAQAHHEHTYQRLVDLGWSHLQTAALVVAATAVCSALALLARGGPPPLQAACAALTVGLCVGYLAIPSVVQIRRGRADEFRP